MIEVENTDVNIVRNLIPMRNLMPGERLWSESHFRLVLWRKKLIISSQVIYQSIHRKLSKKKKENFSSEHDCNIKRIFPTTLSAD